MSITASRTISVSVGIGVGLGAVVLVFWRYGFLSVTGTQASAQIVAASLALVGVIFTTLVSLVAMLVKDSYDRRSAALLQLEGERSAAMARAAEERLKLEAAIRAIQMLANPSGSASLPVQRSGVLFMLASLGQHELTLSLLPQLTKSGDIEPATVAYLLDAAMLHSELRVHRAAVEFIYDHAESLVGESDFEFPDRLSDGAANYAPIVREWAMLGLAKLLIVKPLAHWQRNIFATANLIAKMVWIWRKETEPNLKIDHAAVLRAVMFVLPVGVVIRNPIAPIDVNEVIDQLGTQPAIGSATIKLIADISTWHSATA